MKDHDTVRIVVDEQSSKGDGLQKPHSQKEWKATWTAFCPPVIPNNILYPLFFPLAPWSNALMVSGL